MDTATLAVEIKQEAQELGLQVVGITSADAFPDAREILIERIRAGLLEGLPWFTEERARFASDPKSLMPRARSLISVAASYLADEPEPEPDSGARGRIARYAWTRDYHETLKERLRALIAWIRERAPDASFAAVVDTGRLIDRAIARRAGVGWYGKNANILTLHHGSWVVLGEILTDLDLPPDAPTRRNCGRCARCLPASPTGALIAPGVVDNPRCISFLTIENRGPIPRALRPLIGDWIFGCDLCQEVCPVNGRAQPGPSTPLVVDPRPELVPLLRLNEDEFRRRFRHTAVWRAKRSGFVRNVAVALGNAGDRRVVPALTEALADPDALVRGHAAWALGQLGGEEARRALENTLAAELDEWVRSEIVDAIRDAMTPEKEAVPARRSGAAPRPFTAAPTSPISLERP